VRAAAKAAGSQVLRGFDAYAERGAKANSPAHPRSRESGFIIMLAGHRADNFQNTRHMWRIIRVVLVRPGQTRIGPGPGRKIRA
jgi:hypothetical protein